jgi:hypothetical protein
MLTALFTSDRAFRILATAMFLNTAAATACVAWESARGDIDRATVALVACATSAALYRLFVTMLSKYATA